MEKTGQIKGAVVYGTVRVVEDNAVVEGLTIRVPKGQTGIIAENVRNCTISNCLIEEIDETEEIRNLFHKGTLDLETICTLLGIDSNKLVRATPIH